MRVFTFLVHFLIFALLTILTQVGGILWVVALIIRHLWKLKLRYVFPILYLLANFIFVPIIAKQFGRVPLPRTTKNNIAPVNIWYPLLFRNYLSFEMRKTIEKISNEFSMNNSVNVVYLDANFPFINGFPLLPHLSHNDGDKLDLSFIYANNNGELTNQKPSYSGYGVFEESKTKNSSMTTLCKQKGFWQYDYAKYLTFNKNENLKLSKTATTNLLNVILNQQNVTKVFIEPHLIEHLSLRSEKLRFHGCQAVRHDDHIHLQIK